MSSPEERAGAPRAAEHATPDRPGEPEKGDQEALIRELRQEIEERKQIERELRSGYQRLRDYFESSPLGMAITKPSKEWIEFNDTFCKMLGYSQEELTNKTWADLTHPEDLERASATYERVLAGELDGYDVHKRYLRKDGKPVDVLVSVNAVRRPDRSIDYLAASVFDLTSHIEVERRLRASEQKLTLHIKTTPLAVSSGRTICASNPGTQRPRGSSVTRRRRRATCT